jgi:polyisoprenoid-binding protein YceI
MKFLKCVALFASLSLAFPALALDVDQAQSEFTWHGKKVSGAHYGKVPMKSSSVKVEKGKVVGGEFVLDLSAMTCDDLQGEWKEKFLTHIKSGDFFEVEKYPTAKLVVEKLDGKMAHGKLTIKDKTNPVKFAYTQKGDVYTGSLTFDRTKFGMIYGSGDFFKGLGDKMIYNDVKLDFKVAMKK